MKYLTPLLLSLALCAEEVQVDLRNPIYQDGVLSTDQGGVLTTPDMRIQAMNIQYFHRMQDGKIVQRIEADGDLLIQYKDRVFVGESLCFDFLSKSGIVLDGKTFASLWYVGGSQIFIDAEGNCSVSDAFVTTCENKISSWDLYAKKISLIKDRFFEAERVRIRLWNRLAIWLPSLKLNLKKFDEPIFRYYVNWLKEPKIGIRYQLYSWQNAAIYGRLEYRWKKGWGGALETEYLPEDKRTTFVTKSYAGTDRLYNAIEAQFRYRFQGAFHSESQDERTHTTLTWDKYSDVRMPGDFHSDDFEIATALKTIFYLHHRGEPWLSWIKVQPKVNPFDSIKQDLPTLYITNHPTEWRNSGIISSGFAKASYLNFSYSSQLVESLQNFNSPKVEVYEKLTRPTRIGACTFTPYIAGRGIFYGTSPSGKSQWLGQGDYGAKLHARGSQKFENLLHVIEPYIRYTALTRPTVSLNDHYIFSIQDGLDKLQEVAIGARSLLLSLQESPSQFSADLYATAFFADAAIPQVIPYGYLLLHWQLPSVHIYLDNCYNFRHQQPQFCNARFLWTINENAALIFEARYRSSYAWRKSNYDNFLLDVTQPEQELLLSPISDRRVTLLSNVFFRLNPFWELKWESHHGFYRTNEPPYNEFKIYLSRWVSSSWKLNFYYGYTLHNHFDWTIGIKLMKKEF